MVLINEQSIGTVGRDHASLQAWADATDNDLRESATNTIEKGLIYADGDLANVFIGGAVTDAEHYRILEVAPGEEYDPATDTGATSTASTNTQNFRTNEPFARVIGPILAENTGAINFPRQIWATNPDCTFEKIYARNLTTTLNAYAFDNGTSDRTIFRSCHALGVAGGVGDIGPRWGFNVASGATDVVIENCSAEHLTANAGIGFQILDDSTTLRNCVAIDCDTDFSVGSADIQYCASSDATATGTGSITNVVGTEIWRDSANEDYRLIARERGGVLDGTGVVLDPAPPAYNGGNHGDASAADGAFSIGFYDGTIRDSGPYSLFSNQGAIQPGRVLVPFPLSVNGTAAVSDPLMGGVVIISSDADFHLAFNETATSSNILLVADEVYQFPVQSGDYLSVLNAAGAAAVSVNVARTV